MTGSVQIDAQRAFAREARRRRRAALGHVLRRVPRECRTLPVYGPGQLPAGLPRGVREIALDEITGTLEPSRARQFDRAFRPRGAAGPRWQRIWTAERRGAVLPPISVALLPGGGYAVQDGHHRVSVARARGATTIDAYVG